MFDNEKIIETYDVLTSRIKKDLDEQFKLGRIKGSDYANAYVQLMNTALQLAFKTPLESKQIELYDRQIKGFDDNIKIKLFQAQINAWGSMVASGMLEAKPAIINDDEVSKLYNELLDKN